MASPPYNDFMMNFRNLVGFVFCSIFVLTQTAIASPTEGEKSYARLLQKVATPQGVLWKAMQKTEKSWLAQALKENETRSLDSFEEPNEQLAFWINAYNACVLKFISEHMPIADVMMIEGFRDKLTCLVAGTERTLINMESDIIRPLFKNPKVHFALWWGTKGSPRLRSKPYQGKELDQALSDQTKNFIEAQKAVRIEEQTVTPSKEFPGKAPKDQNPEKPGIQVFHTTLSPLFDWYRTDFGEGDEVLGFILKYLPERSAMYFPRKLSDAHFSAFNWELDQPK